MATDHTPGPWHIVDREIMEDGSVYPCHILGGAADYQVCTLESPDIAKHGVEKPHLFPGLNGVLGPNARLIAAAPELLEALEDLEQQGWFKHIVSLCKKETSDSSLFDSVTKARAAIAKARGSQ